MLRANLGYIYTYVLDQHMVGLDILWTKDAEMSVRNHDDLQFLLSMKTDLIASLGYHNKVLTSQIQHTQSRKDKKEERKERAEKLYILIILYTAESSSDKDQEDIAEQEVTYRKSHNRVSRPGTPAFLQHDILTNLILVPEVLTSGTRIKLTSSQQAAFTEAFIEKSGGDPNSFYLCKQQTGQGIRQTNRLPLSSNSHKYRQNLPLSTGIKN